MAKPPKGQSALGTNRAGTSFRHLIILPPLYHDFVVWEDEEWLKKFTKPLNGGEEDLDED